MKKNPFLEFTVADGLYNISVNINNISFFNPSEKEDETMLCLNTAIEESRLKIVIIGKYDDIKNLIQLHFD